MQKQSITYDPVGMMIAGLQTGLKQIELIGMDRPEATAGTVVIKVAMVGVCGSDLHSYRSFNGRCGFPPGHELSGVIVAKHADVTDLSIGQRVTVDMVRGTACGKCEYCQRGTALHCLSRDIPFGGGFAEYVRTKAEGVFPLPDEVDDALGALVEPIAVGVHAVRCMKIGAGMSGLIVGAGTIGLSALAAALDAGSETVYVAAKHPVQASAAMAMGASGIIPMNPDEAQRAVKEVTAGGLGFDYVIETVGGSAPTLDLSCRFTRPLGAVGVLGAFDGGFKAIDIHAAHVKELTVHLPNCYGVIDGKHDYDFAIDLLARKGEVLRAMITHELPLINVDEAFRIADDKSMNSIKVQCSAQFDRDAYLAANPDVALAGCDPVEHYLAHGRREGRRLML